MKHITTLGIRVFLLVCTLSAAAAQTYSEVGFNGSTAGCALPASNYPWLTTPSYVTQIPKPSFVNISYNVATSQFYFQVNATYVPSYSRYVISFENFNDNTNLKKSGACDNYVGTVYPSANAPFFLTWWSHLPNAILAAQYNSTVGGYLANGPNGIWNVGSNDCGTITYSATISNSFLANCRNGFNNNTQVTSQYIQSLGLYNIVGTLYVTLLAPTNPSGSQTNGYNYIYWTYPFSLFYSAETDSVSAPSALFGALEVYFNLLQVYIDATGILHLFFNMQVYSSSAYNLARVISISSTSGPVPLCTSGGFANVNQTIPFTNTYIFAACSASSGAYAGTYVLSNQLTACVTPGGACNTFTVPYSFTTDIATNPTVNSSASSFTSQILAYTDSTFSTPLPALVYQGQKVCALTSLTGLSTQQRAAVYFTIVEVYMCTSSSGTPVTYDGVNNLGCQSQPSMITIVSDSQLVATVDPSYYNAALYQYFTNTSSGICILARPVLQDPATLATYSQGTGQYIHVVGYVSNRTGNYTYSFILNTPVSSKRSIKRVPGQGGAPSSILNFFVNSSNGNVVAFNYNRAPMSHGAVAGVVVGGFVFILLVVLLVYFVMPPRSSLRYKKRKYRSANPGKDDAEPVEKENMYTF